MASDAATASTPLAVDDCVGFAEPADILTRLTPDDLHPARLAGPHAWHPWGLTAAPPTDRHLRLVLSPGTRPTTRERVMDALQDRLGRTPWPPESPLEVRHSDSRLDCRDDDGRRSLIEVTVRSRADVADQGHAEVVTRAGWPILGELATLNDRIRCVNIEQPSRTDLADLASWVEHKMAEPAGASRLTASLPQLLTDQARDHPSAADRLRTILTHRQATTGHPARVLTYLAEQLDQNQTISHTRSR
jgi:hypothetical protein